MQTPLNTLDTKEPLDYDNLNIITRPRPPRRRQTGVSLIPFRPYVKCLTSVRQPFSFANGYDRWMVIGRDEIFFTQPNARCIGSLIEDCDISDVIRWDIEGESTRLPMMCKLWMIVDGAVVERGRPHLVQDAAIQVFTSGRNLRSILATQRHYNQTLITTTVDRRRRQSWQDVNEYHSVSYYQYTCAVRRGFHKNIQCNIDNEHLISKQEILSDVEEEIVDENQMKSFRKEKVQETIHHSLIPQDRVHISIMTQTENRFLNRSTSIDSQFIYMFNLNLETNELLLSSIANPYRRVISSNYSSDVISIYRNGIEYKHRSISTGDDYPHWWLRLNTDFILSDFIKIPYEEKEKKYLPSPSPRHNQSVQTDIDESRISSSSRSVRIQKSSSSATTTNHYESIDDINRQRIDSHNDINCRLNDYKTCTHNNKQSDNDYNIFVSSLNHHGQQSYSTPDYQSHRVPCHCFSNDTTRTQTKTSDSTSTTLLANLLERYEKTLRERQRAIAIINDELLDIDDVLKHYREKIQNSSSKQSNIAMELYRDISLLSKDDRPPSTTTINIIKDKYRSMPGLTSEEMIKAYMPSPKVHITKCLLDSSRQRQPRFLTPSTVITRPNYCDLCLTGHHRSSAWIQYNERRIEELQKRIDLMLQIDDIEEAQLLLSSTPIIPTTATVTQRIDDILSRRSKYRDLHLYDYYRFLSPCRYQYRLHHRLNQSLPNIPRLLNRGTTHSTTPVSKSVRICTESVSPRTIHRRSRSASRPLVSILRHSSVPAMSRPTRLIESSHIYKSKVDGKIYDLKEFTIPRYYRLYNDVSFREIYNFSRLLDAYLQTNRIITEDYSKMIKNFALKQQLPSPITSVA
ncbi:unnamed protein product [Rotaria sp. Silwood1]|nr:unnamed protein product [Rotaria sp. Silwood1]